MNTALLANTRPLASLLRDVLSLFKLRIGVLIMVTALVGFIATPGRDASAWQVLVLALATLVASASAGAYNHYHDHDSDRLMASRSTAMRAASGRPRRSATVAPGPATARVITRSPETASSTTESVTVSGSPVNVAAVAWS